jgi:hypothetical protein
MFVCLAPWCNWLTRGPFKAESPGSSPGGATKINNLQQGREADDYKGLKRARLHLDSGRRNTRTRKPTSIPSGGNSIDIENAEHNTNSFLYRFAFPNPDRTRTKKCPHFWRLKCTSFRALGCAVARLSTNDLVSCVHPAQVCGKRSNIELDPLHVSRRYFQLLLSRKKLNRSIE